MSSIFNSNRFAYLEDLTQEEDKDLESNKYLIEITLPFQYTPENIEKLDALFQRGLIASHPVADPGSNSVVWIWRNAEGKRDRDGDLPAVQSSANDQWAWYTNGVATREAGPATIVFTDDGIMIEWIKNGRILAISRHASGRDSYTCTKIEGSDVRRAWTASREQYIAQIAGDFPDVKKIFAKDYEFMREADASMIRSASVKKAYYSYLNDLPAGNEVKWTILETGWGSEDMPAGSIVTQSFDIEEVAQACIDLYNQEGAQWEINGKMMKPEEYVNKYLETDAYNDGRNYTVDFCYPHTDKKKVAFYCEGRKQDEDV